MTDYTVQLFDMLVKKPAIGLSQDVMVEAKKACEAFVRDGKSGEEAEKAMIVFGKQAWPYWQAHRVFVERFGEEKEQEFMKDLLSPELSEKYTSFLTSGGSIHNFRSGQEYEDAFTSEEDVAIQEATVQVKSAIEDFVVRLAQSEEKKSEYSALVLSYQQERDDILTIIETLQSLATTHEKWSEEIAQDIYYIEKGFAELEERPSKEKAQGRLDWYTGQIGSTETHIFS